MKKRKTKAFTLIELLAVIVILAIIALIAVPVILNIIDKANKSAFKDTAYGIISAGELYYTDREMSLSGMNEDKTFTFPNNIKDLPIKGKLPTSGWVTVNKDGNISLEVSDGRYCATKGFDDTEITVVVGNCGNGENELQEEKNVVYFNPEINDVCSDYTTINSKTGITDGCLKWYIYKTDGTKQYLILDHNIVATSPWIDVSSEKELNYFFGLGEITGEYIPVTLYNKLAQVTKKWTVEPGIISLDELLEMIPWYETLNDEEKQNWYGLYQEELEKTMSDIMTRVESNIDKNATDEEFIMAMLDEADKTDIFLPSYMYKDLISGYISPEIGAPMGYWTKSIDLDSQVIWSLFVYMLQGSTLDNTTLGIRPTIVLENNKGIDRQVTEIMMLYENLDINIGQSKEVSLVLPLYNSTLVNYTSSNNNVATVDENGIVTGVSEGTTTITASTKDGSISKTLNVTVSVPATDIQLNTTTLSLVNGGTYQLEATVLPNNATNKELSYNSADPSIATVSTTGIVKGISGGTTTITISTTDGSNISKTVEVTVRQMITSLTLDSEEITVGIGLNETVTATILPTSAYNKTLNWTSGDTSVATVSNGTITGISEGTTTITVSTTDGSNISKIIKVTVNPGEKTLTALAVDNFTVSNVDGSNTKVVTKPACLTDGTTCTAGTPVAVKVNENDTYRFYVLKEENNEVTLILDRNLYAVGNTTEPNVAWIDANDYTAENNKDATPNSCSNTSCNDEGPITALNKLKERTAGWTNISEKTFTVSGLDEKGTKKYDDIQVKGRARLITYEEATSEEVGCTGTNGDCPAWMYINLRNTGDANTSGYWTLNAFSSDTFQAWYVRYGGKVSTTYGSYYTTSGVRPVIELLK